MAYAAAAMFEGNYPQLMAAYNATLNEKVYDAAATLDDVERKRDRGAYFKSIHATLDHLVWGDGAWLGRFDGNTYTAGPIGALLYEDFDALRAARRALDAKIIAWADSIDAEWLATPMTWTSKLYGFTQTHPRWVQVTQMFNHQTHHRGQVTTLLTQAGVDVGATDLPTIPLLRGTL
jgi:uncharacterized damage-inducible protein DinB